MPILITGGAGYIGSATVELLLERGEQVVVLDDLYRGHREALDPGIPFYDARVGDTAAVARIVREHKIDACIHFAAVLEVGESVKDPGSYFLNNTGQGMAFLRALVDSGVSRIVFSSTAATYGEPKQSPIPEDHPQWPSSPYGWSKFMMERILETYDTAYGLKSVALRYFNASGATTKRGEDHTPESHLIPNVLKVALGQRSHISVFGSDYPTPDGTCVRDYIHVSDLASAHYLALEYLKKGGASEHINLGNGKGYSVLEVVEAARKVTGHAIPTKMEPRRPGDPSVLVASSEKARRVLGWEPRFPALEDIIESAWRWHKSHPTGYVPR